MADYYSLLNRAIAGLPEQGLESRRAIYDRVRAALTKQLQNIEPALAEEDITRERLALEEAIRRNEQELAKNAMVAHARPLEKPTQLEKPKLEKPATPLKLPPLPTPKTQPVAPAQSSFVRFDVPQDIKQPKISFFAKLTVGFATLAFLLGVGWFFVFKTNVVSKSSLAPVVVAPTPPPAPANTKSAERVPTDQEAKTTAQSTPAAALESKVILFEEAQSGMNANSLLQGQVKWALETVNIANAPAETAVVARITISERKMNIEMRLRRNLDQTLPASHTIELNFNYPLDANTTAIANIPGILMKTGEQTRGQPLSGLSVKVTGNFFLIGLSSSDADVIRNVQFLREWSWFDIPIEFENRRRSIISLEKGTDGERVINDALALWAR